MTAERYIAGIEAEADRQLALVHGRAKSRPDSRPSQDSQPEPLRRPTPPPKPFPIDALGEILGGAVRAIAGTVCSPIAMVGNSVLAAASLAVQPHAVVVVDGRTTLASIYMLTVGESGSRKSATDGPALKSHREVERQRFEQYRAESGTYRTELKAYESAVAQAGRLKGDAERRAALQDIGPAPDEPLLANLICSEPTLEGLHKLLMGGRGYIGLFSDEGGQFFGGHAMAKEHVARTAAGLSSLWDSGTFDRVRAGDGASKVFGKRLSAHLMLQPVIAERVLSDAVLSGQGFLARCLIAWPESTAGTRMYVEQDLGQNPAVGRYWERMTHILTRPLPLALGTRNELAPRTLQLTPAAKQLWMQMHDAIELRNGPDGEYSQIRSNSSKAAEQILRIACILAVTEDPDTLQIDVGTIERSGSLVDFYLAEAVRLVGTAEVSPDVRRAEAVLAWCHERRKTLVHSAELVRLGPNCIRERQQLTKAMDELERCGWAEPIPGGAEIDGSHRRHVWRLRLEG